MRKAKTMSEILTERERIEPIADRNGTKIVTYDEYTSLAMAEATEPTMDLGDRVMNADGSVAKTRKRFAATNPDNLFINRFRLIHTDDGDKMEIVVDSQAITEQDRGRIYVQRVPSYIIARNAKGKLFVEKSTTVQDTEFVSEFTRKLNNDAMREILPLIASEGRNISTENITI